MKVVPISISQINWAALLTSFSKVPDNPFRVLDKNNQESGQLSGFIQSVEMKKQDSKDYIKMLENPIFSLPHLFCGFLAILDEDTYINLIEFCTLKILNFDHEERKKKLIIISGTFDEWHKNIYMGCQEKRNQQIIEFFNTCFNWFTAFGLDKLWDKKRLYLEKK